VLSAQRPRPVLNLFCAPGRKSACRRPVFS
jgi:hypothetical protein